MATATEPAVRKYVKIPPDVAEVLRGATCQGNELRLPPTQLDRPLYARVDKVIRQLGGDWNKRSKVHLFDGDAAPLLSAALADGKVLNHQQSYQLFETPTDVAERMVDLAELGPGMLVLEPSAGRGRLVRAVLARQPDSMVIAIECDAAHVRALRDTGASVSCGDFLEHAGPDRDDVAVDRVLMNPPFSRGQDMAHIRRAFDWLKPGGRLVAIVGQGAWAGSTRSHAKFRTFVGAHIVDEEELPPGTFKESGTDVGGRIIVLVKEHGGDVEPSVAPSGEPASPPRDHPPAVDPTAQTKGRFTEVPTDSIEESKTNPRRVFASLNEMADSMRAHGVLEPLLVRPNPAVPWEYELVAGARRLRAAKLAMLDVVPVIVRELSDRDVLEIQVIENDQREDVHPLDQAVGYRRLIDEAGYDVAELVARTGRSETYIYQRLQLTNLAAEAQEWFLAGKIQLGHAQLIARLDASQQATLLKDWLFQSLRGTYGHSAPFVAQVKAKIEELFHLNLASAAFPKDAADLVKDVVACVVCPKRAGNSPSLWPDVTKADTCTDPACFRSKERAFVQLQVRKAEAKAPDVIRISVNSYNDKKGVLGSGSYEIVGRKDARKAKTGELKTAVVIDRNKYGGSDDPRPGQVVLVRVKARSSTSAGSGSEDSWKQRQERDRKLRELHEAARQTTAAALIAKITVATPAELAQVVADRWSASHEVAHAMVAGSYGWKTPVKSIEPLLRGLTVEGLALVLLRLFVADEATAYVHPPQKLPEILKTFAALYGVDHDAAVREQKAKRKEQDKAEKKAKPKTKSRKGNAIVATKNAIPDDMVVDDTEDDDEDDGGEGGDE